MEIEVGGRTVRLTNLDKVLWPRTGFTKGDLVDHHLRVAAALLPHVVGRPLTLHRFPDGVDGPHWYETRCPPHPPWLRQQRMHTFRRSGKQVDACVIDDIAGLVWAAQVAAVELHPFLAPADDLEHPTVAVFDLDPGEPAGMADACRAALAVRGLLADLGLRCVVKTSGAKGLHVAVPVESGHTYADTKTFVRAVAGLLVRADPDRMVDRMARSVRSGKVFVDWSQNDAGKSTVAPYSLRGLPVPTVATPLMWDEVEAAAATDDPLLWFAPAHVLDRLDRHGDLFAGALDGGQRLPLV